MAGLIQNAMVDPKKINTGGTDTYQAGSTGYDPAKRNVDVVNETVAGNVDKLLKADSPYITQARTGAAQTANSRGLINSSIAAGAGEDAAIRSVLPIASADANTFTTAARDNQAAENAGLQFTAGASNQATLSNTSDLNQTQRTAQAGTIQSNLSAQDAAQKASLLTQDAAQKAELIAKQGAIDTALQTLRGDQATGLANIDASFKSLLQANSLAASEYQTTTQAMAAVMADANTSPEQKQAAVTKISQMLKSGLTLIGSMANVDIAGLLDFSAA